MDRIDRVRGVTPYGPEIRLAHHAVDPNGSRPRREKSEHPDPGHDHFEHDGNEIESPILSSDDGDEPKLDLRA